MRRLVFLIAILFLVSGGAVSAQDESSETTKFGDVPKEVMQDVVRRILIFKFKPASKRKKIFLAKQIYFSDAGSDRFYLAIAQSWLPEIKNIEFQLLTTPFSKDVYFFKEQDSKSSVYELSFSFGDPTCEYSGDLWKFRVFGVRSRLWLDGGVGGGCSAD